MRLKKIVWIPLAVVAVLMGFYPVSYYILDMHSHGVLQNKPASLLASYAYIGAFYTHITFGGIALLIGWLQFSKKIRAANINFHRMTGRAYVLSVLFSSLGGLAIAFFADGGWVCTAGFGLLALTWLFSDIQAYRAIRRLDITTHRKWMIRNYSLTFAAVTLRIYLPLALLALHMDFIPAYRIISWLAWVPNLFVAEILIRKWPEPETSAIVQAQKLSS